MLHDAVLHLALCAQHGHRIVAERHRLETAGPCKVHLWAWGGLQRPRRRAGQPGTSRASANAAWKPDVQDAPAALGSRVK